MDHESHQNRRVTTAFGSRIILIVLTIMALSQALGSFLSVLSFEKIILEALTYKYEILGKDLKRKIEQSLKFGKSLDRFLGMDRLVEPLFRYSKDLNEVFLSDSKGKILFTSGKVEFVVAKGTAETDHPRGKVLLGDFETKKTFPVDELFDWKEKGSFVWLHQGRYYILFPIVPHFSENKGILGLGFSQSVVDEKKRELISSSRNRLVGFAVITALLVGLVIKFIFVAPVRRQVTLLTDLMRKDGVPPERDQLEVPEEILEVQLNMVDFIARTQRAKSALKEALDELEQMTPDNTFAGYEIGLMKDILEGKTDEEN